MCPSCGRQEAGSFCPVDGTALVAQAAPDLPAQQIDRYRLLRQVGRGAMGDVFEAEHIHIGKRVALKLLHRDLARDPSTVERLRREARTAGSIGHPNIVEMEDFGITPDGAVYLVMEWLPGETVADRIDRGPVSQREAIDIVRQTCAGLGAAHAAGVIHRDLKPANIFLARQRDGSEVVKILDFGIAKLLAGDSRLTRTGVFVGTPDYVSPEQAMGEEVDVRADIYSAGVLLYRLLTDTVPFHGDSFMAVLHQHTMKPPEPPSRRAPDRNIPAALEAVTMRCLEKRPADRFSSAAELDTALAAAMLPGASPAAPAVRLRDPEPDDSLMVPRRSKAGLWIALFLLAGGAGVAGFFLLSSREEGAPVAAGALDAGHRDPADTRPPGPIAVEVPRIDAGMRPPDAGPAEPTASAWTFGGKGDHLDYKVVITPGVVAPGQPFDLDVTIAPAPALARSWSPGRVQATISLVHYQAHALARRETYPLVGNNRVTANVRLERAGKHHVELSLLEGGRQLARARFDICIGADPAAPGAELERVCPRMNRATPHAGAHRDHPGHR
jgi:serine/threonine-protein kinase